MPPLSEWAKKIEESELPILQYTATSIMHKVDREDTSTGQLAKIILKDSSLTSRLLRISNSVIFNPSRLPVNTIHRAVLFIGFDMIRSLCLSLSLIDTLLKSNTQDQVKSLMAKSFNCAVMAKELAERRGDKAPEEVFVAALLSSIGEMSFWCVADEKGEEICQHVEKTGCSLKQAQQDVLGFTFDELTVALTSDLKVGKLLEESFSGKKSSDPRTRDVQLGHQFAEEAGDSPDNFSQQKIIMEISEHLGLDESKTREIVKQQSITVKETVKEYGANEIASYLPKTPTLDAETEDEEGLESALVRETEEEAYEFPESDAALQMGILKDLGNALEASPNPNVILEIILEGITRGVGMDRSLFALLGQDRSIIVGKFALGYETEVLNEKFRFQLIDGNIFTKVFDKGQSVWVQEGQKDSMISYVDTAMLKILATESFMLYPIIINQKPVGIIYADRQPSKREITNDQFMDFKHFGQQACMAISHLSGK